MNREGSISTETLFRIMHKTDNFKSVKKRTIITLHTRHYFFLKFFLLNILNKAKLLFEPLQKEKKNTLIFFIIFFHFQLNITLNQIQ